MDIIKAPTEITKSTLKEDSQKIIDAVLNGDLEAMRVQLHIKALEEMIKTIKSGIRDAVLHDADKYTGDDSFPAKITISQTGDRVNYDSDQEYSDIKAALKKREDDLKGAYYANKEGRPYISSDGEEVPICKASKESEVIVKFEFKK